MNAALRSTTRAGCWILTVALVAALTLVGCGDDDDEDYTETYQNCQTLDYGARGQYNLCCTATCNYHWDDDKYVAQCQQSLTCTTTSGAACPSWVIDDNRYPPCPYY